MDLYAVLGVAKTASTDEVRSAYRKLAFQFHPDRNPGDKDKERQFKEISAAYDVLSDDAKRSRYDFERGRPARGPVPVPAPFFRSGRGGFTFRPGPVPWSTFYNSTGAQGTINVGATVQIRINPQMAGQTVEIQMNGTPVPGVFVFVRRT